MLTTGDRIREIRERKKLTQDQLASKANISKGFLSDVENNNKNPSSQLLLKIANALGASVDYLLSGEKRERSQTEPIMIPPELSEAAVHLNLTYNETLALLNAHSSVVARRSAKSQHEFTIEQWEEFHDAISKMFD